MTRQPLSIFRALVFGALAVLCFAAEARAQFNAGVQGTVTDANGAAVAGATVTLTSNETGRSQQTTSSEDGFYRFGGLAPGSYKLVVAQTGFQNSTLENLHVSAEAVQGADITLTTGGLQEVVTVTSEGTAALETENANVSRAITTQEIRELPQVGRDPYELLRLTPGVFGTGARGGNGNAVGLPNTAGPGGSSSSVFQTENQVQISANGQRVSANNFQIDGVSVNSLGWGGAAVVTPNQESVKEVRVVSTTYSAEDGRNSGAQVKVVSENGTNAFHGSLFMKYNSPGLNAFNRYNGPVTPQQRVERTFRQFGGSLGGPLYLPRFGEGGPTTWGGRDKLFFFVSYEGLRENTNQSRVSLVETPEFRDLVRRVRPTSLAARLFSTPGVEPRIIGAVNSSCAALPGLICQQVAGGLDIGSPTAALGQRIPNPFTAEGRAGGGLDGIPDIQFAQVAFPNRFRGNQFNARFDYVRGASTFTLSTYLTRRNDLQTDNDNPQARPIADLTFKPFNSSVSLIWNHVISPTTLNEARFNLTRFAYNQVASSDGVTDFGIPRIKVEGLGVSGGSVGLVTLPNTIFFGAGRSETTPGIFAQNTYEFRDVLTKNVGNHGFKFGGEIRKEQDNSNLAGGARPEYSFWTLFGLANDAPILEVINTDPTTGAAADFQRYFRTSTYGLFVQDDWKARPNLTINIGLRWEYFTPIEEKQGRLSNFILGPAGRELTAGRVTQVERLFEPDRNNFAPRLGFAWSPQSIAGRDFENRLVLRGGFGISYNRIFNNILSNVRGNTPFAARRFVCCAFDEGATDVIRQIFYTFGRDNTPFGFATNPNLTPGIDPTSGGLVGSSVEIYGTPPELPNAYVYSYSLDGEYLLPYNMVAMIGYQGSSSHKLIRTTNLNFVYDADNPSFFQIFFPLADVNANFNALNATLMRRFSRGFQLTGLYTWSKSIDTLSFEFGGNANQTDPRNIGLQRGPSDYDVRHRFTLSGLWDLPVFRGRRDAVGRALGGWQLSGILTTHTGFPWTPKHCNDLNRDGQGCFERAARYFGGALEGSNDNFTQPGGIFPGGGTRYFDITTVGTPGVGRNTFRGPRYFNIDMSLAKKFGLSGLFGMDENAHFEARANVFNLFNTLNLSHFNYGDQNTFIFDPNFGRALGALSGRVVEFQGRFRF